MIIHSLRFRLFLTLISVVIVAVGVVVLLTSRATTSEFQHYLERDTLRTQIVTDAVLAYYAREQGKDDVQAIAVQLAQMLNERVILLNATSRVVADSEETLLGQLLDSTAPISAVVVTLGQPLTASEMPSSGRDQSADVLVSPGSGTTAGAPLAEPNALVVPLPIAVQRPFSPQFDPIENEFILAVNRSLIIAVVVAGLLSLVLTAGLSRRILGPVENLMAVAHKMEQGDLSQRVQVQSKDEIGELGHAFNAMADGLSRVERLRRSMVTDVAHELRTPLSNIRGYLEGVRDGVIAPDVRLINSLHEEAMLLNRLIDDLQELSLAEAGQLRLVQQMIPLKQCIEQAASMARPALVEKGLTLLVDLPDNLPLVNADAGRIGQVVRNLLNNAITHTPGGGTVTICVRDNAEEVLISVQDTGVGISREDLPNIFERFFRADRSRARATGGAGLGLTIVKQLVAAQGGRVWAESELGHGSTFTFTLPVQHTSDVAQPASA